ncbi:MAG: hypothetical protein KJ795_14995 [Gammaproteobacteria bacterium]|nr:hypothetical protein [Gammaproteobacteria bacterium]MBU1777352.1 hypothetical protein [Gammaproteobacteria bacterium]MBU1968483.1 hypothetical protein [Gammaproteobacteria bacterium]
MTLFSISPVASAAELGRLFYTPQQRQQMDYHIVGGMEEEVARNYIVVNGVVQKQGGKRTMWVNGTEQADGLTLGKSPARAAVTPPGKSNTVILKVGEKLLLDTPVQNSADDTKLANSVPAQPASEEDD